MASDSSPASNSALPTPDPIECAQSALQLELVDAQRRELARLQIHFHGAIRAQLKPLAHAIGVSERTVRNNKNLLRINGVAVRPSLVSGSITYDLEQVARALALADVQPPPPARLVAANLGKGKAQPQPEPVKKTVGRTKKVDLAAQLDAGVPA